MRLTNPLLTGTLCLAMAAGLTSCFDDPEGVDEEWRTKNIEYFENAKTERTDDGELKYFTVTPSWSPGAAFLMRWEIDPALNAHRLKPLDTSTVDFKYVAYDIDGALISSSYNLHANGDSIYRTTPSQMIAGVRQALLMMSIGDSATVVLPAAAAYGNRAYGDVKANSTLLYHLKLKNIPAYETPEK